MSEAPDLVWLQWYGDGEPDDFGHVSQEDVTWSTEQVFKHDVAYMRDKLNHALLEAAAKMLKAAYRKPATYEDFRAAVVEAADGLSDAMAGYSKST